MSRRDLITVVFLALPLACSTTTQCDCLPSRTHFIVFGEVQRAGVRVPGARVVVSAARTLGANPCDSASAPETFAPDISTGADGRFRAHVFSEYGPALRCVRVTAIAGQGSSQDSVTIAGLRLQFRFEQERPDSLGLVLQLP